ncbi:MULTISPECIES: efflux RND transporter periplasmic adaptor subunit [Paenibacillus]|uniref:Efflux RND transporter periplasmic adaptor subunit n=1 Tax=Paenibacillus radicis (ex Xue et al. 2023) TaxID=2972489 RepID=A0ABT1YNZ4_9BACL|nr:efflux RND transporter periplasmic adaptor subunit [Paenibacillus radicis (ex Xue et al. 2023)]MCR8634898.1 efflux RND transporter periplasmic adaptor subunit [Paenibacillus radicis (ex Xue et al. 2023)]
MNLTLMNTVKQSTKVVGAVVLSAALITGCTSPAAQPQPNAAETVLKTVKVDKISKKSIGDPQEQVADIVSSISMDIVTKVNGDVLEIYKKRGDSVQKGEVIVKLDPTDVQLQKQRGVLGVKSASQQLTKAKEDLANSKVDLQNAVTKTETAVKDAEKNYSKARNDYDLGLITKFQLDQMETQFNNIKLDLESAKNKLNTLETTNSLSQLETQMESSTLSVREADRTLDNLELKAPVSGVLTELPIEVGMSLSGGFRAAQVQQLDPIKIKAELTEASAALVRGKNELSFYIPGSTEKLKGTVSYLANVMSTQSKSYSLELEVPNANTKLKPGSKVQLLLTEEKDEVVITVPTLSVVREGGDTFVFVLVGDTAEKRKVQLGRLNETNQEVLSGVKEGEQLIIFGQNQLKDKEKVQLAK